jgi:hypothetical protein
MYAPGGGEFAGGSAGYGTDPAWVGASPRLVDLAGALDRLVAASDGVAEAVTRHDRAALERSNSAAAEIVEEVNALAADLSDYDRAMFDVAGITALRARLAEGSRRNAYLIEQAWAVDAALMRLLIGGGRVEQEGAPAGYSSAPGPAYVDRGA